ncbi:MAG: hypothetical protein AB7P21_28000 [Lautropia sp.]
MTRKPGTEQPIRIGVEIDADALPVFAAILFDALARDHAVEWTLLALKGSAAAPADAGSGDGTDTSALRSRVVVGLVRAVLALEGVALKGAARLLPSLACRISALPGPAAAHAGRFAEVLRHRHGVPADRRANLDLLLQIGRPSPAETAARAAADLAGAEDDGGTPVPGPAAPAIVRIELGGAETQALALAGLHEVLDGLAETPLALYRLDPRTQARTCIVAGGNRTRPLLLLNQAALWDRAASLLRCHLDPAQRTGEATVTSWTAGSRSAPVAAPAAPARDAEILARLLAYPLRTGARALRYLGERYRGRRQWSVAIHQAGAGHGDLGPALDVAPTAPGAFQADPMICASPDTGVMHCFVEEFDPAAGRAHIAVLEQDGGRWRHRGIAIAEPHHLSFPFLFRYQDALYMCPDRSSARDITVYRCRCFPLEWVPCATLMNDVCAADTLLFERNDRWWMLTNIDRAASPDNQNELHLFHADSPLSDTWVPVPGNPVRFGVGGARNAGLSTHDGRLYRFGQSHSFDAYGKGLLQFEIVHVAPDGYREVFVREIAPPPESGAMGIHTWSDADGLVAIDLLGATSSPRGASARPRSRRLGLAGPLGP